MAYVDGFVLPVESEKLAAYLELAESAAKIFREYGALEYREAVGEDLDVPHAPYVPFPALARVEPGETVVFSWIVYRSRAHRDEVNAKVMSDPRFEQLCSSDAVPFNCARMAYGGFEIKVAA